MDHEAIKAAFDRVNQDGEPVVEIDPNFIKRYWEVDRTIPEERRRTTAIGLQAIAGGTELADLAPEQHVGMMVRFMLFNSLAERGFLKDYLSDESRQDALFRALATLPCDRRDLAEAIPQQFLREASPEDAEKFRQQMTAAGCDFDHPRFVSRLDAFMQEQK